MYLCMFCTPSSVHVAELAHINNSANRETENLLQIFSPVSLPVRWVMVGPVFNKSIVEAEH